MPAASSDYHPLRGLYLARLREFYRQPARLFWVYGFPTILALGLGLAFQGGSVESVPVDVVRNADTPAVEAALKVKAPTSSSGANRTTGRPEITVRVEDEATALARLRTGKTPIVVVPGPGGTVSYRFDPTRPESSGARATVDRAIQEHAGRVDPVRVTDEPITEPGSRYIDFLVPGLIGQNTMGGGLWGVGFLLVNFRMAKLLKRFAATPMPRRDFLLAILGARLTFLLPDVLVMLSVGMGVFGVPMKGSWTCLIAVEIVGALAFAGIGLLVASRATTTETVSGLMNLVMLPMMIFSGLFFSSERFPQVMQPVIRALPLTQLLDALRAIMLEGADWSSRVVLVALAVLGAYAVGTFTLALRWFRWQ